MTRQGDTYVQLCRADHPPIGQLRWGEEVVFVFSWFHPPSPHPPPRGGSATDAARIHRLQLCNALDLAETAQEEEEEQQQREG